MLSRGQMLLANDRILVSHSPPVGSFHHRRISPCDNSHTKTEIPKGRLSFAPLAASAYLPSGERTMVCSDPGRFGARLSGVSVTVLNSLAALKSQNLTRNESSRTLSR